MLNANEHKNFTACADSEAEELLEKVLSQMGESLADSGLCVVLGGSYGRGEGGVRSDRDNGILYNDLDFFVFTRKKQKKSPELLREIAEKYEKELHVDIDFSAPMSAKEIKNNTSRLMMQELKRGYRLVSGEDLLEEYLEKIPPKKILYSESLRLIFNRGMGLIFAARRIAENSGEIDFILRNINKAVLGAIDALLLADGVYCWHIAERLKYVEESNFPEKWKELYKKGVEFKTSPSREVDTDLKTRWEDARNLLLEVMLQLSGSCNCADLTKNIYKKSKQKGELSLKNYVKYCLKLKCLPIRSFRIYMQTAVAVLQEDLYMELSKAMEDIDDRGQLYYQWLLFN